MARIPLLDENDPTAPEDARAFLGNIIQRYGEVVNVWRVMANSPKSAQAVFELLDGAYLSSTNLDRKQLELAFFTASALNRCHYCIPMHTVLGRSIGLSEAQMRHMVDDPLPTGVYDEAEAAVVRFAQKSTRLEPIDKATYTALTRHFTSGQIVDLSLTVGLGNMINRFSATFLTEVDAGAIAQLEQGDAAAGGCPVPRPVVPEVT